MTDLKAEVIMIKKICMLISAAIISNMCFFGAAYAQTEDMKCSVNIDVDSHTVYGTAELADSSKTHKIIVKVVNGENEIVYANELYPNDSGTVAFSYINEDDNGEYTMTFYSKTLNETEVFDFSMLSASKIEELCSIVNEERAKNTQSPPVAPNADAVADVYLNYGGGLSIDMTEYESLEDKEKVFELIAAESTKINNAAELTSAFYNAVMRQKINTAHSSADVEAFLSNSVYHSASGYDNIPVADEKNVYESSDDKIKSAVAKSIAEETYSSEQQLKDEVVFQVLAVNIKNSTLWNNLLPVVKAYCDAGYLNISDDEYEELTDDNYILRELIGKSYSSYDDIEEAIEEAYNGSKNSGGSSSGGGGSSSGGGGGSTGGGTVGGIVVRPPASAAPMESTSDPDSTENRFVDMDDYKWAIQAVNALYERGIISGVDNEHFEPGRGITRAEFVKILVCVCGWDGESNSSDFADVAESDWYYPYISTAFARRVVLGNEDNTFRPNKIIDRYELAVMVSRIMDYYGIPDKNTTVQRYEYDDDAEIPEWAKDSVYKAQYNGIILANTGNDFDGEIETTRAYAASVVYKLVNEIERTEAGTE